MIKTIVIDDVKKNRDAVKIAANKYCPSILLVGEADNVNSGIMLIQEAKPQLVFLDVEMQDGTGFDVLKEFTHPTFKVIFITGYEDYAFKAFQVNAFKYLLKPIDKNEFIAAVNHLEKQLETENVSQQISSLINQRDLNSAQNKKIVLRTSDRIVSKEIKEIMRCESENAYTTFYFNTSTKLIVSGSLKEFEEKLGDNFFRIHQSHLINLDYFDYYSKTDGGWIIMKDGSKLPLASRKKDDFLKIIQNL